MEGVERIMEGTKFMKIMKKEVTDYRCRLPEEGMREKVARRTVRRCVAGCCVAASQRRSVATCSS